MPDITLICVDGKHEFIFDEREQNFFKEKGWDNPKRCIPHRREAKRKNHKRSPERAPREDNGTTVTHEDLDKKEVIL